MRRYKLIAEIYAHGDFIGANKLTLAFLLAGMSDKKLTEFHLEFMQKKPYTEEEQGIIKN